MRAGARQIASGARLEITNAAPLAALAIKSALMDHGVRAEIVAHARGYGDGAVLTEGLVDARDPTTLHSQALQQVRMAHQAFERGGILIAFQHAGSGWSEGMSGLIKTASHEYPDTLCRVLEVEAELPGQETLGGELVFGQEGEIRYGADGARRAPVHAPIAPPEDTPRPGSGTWLVTGGGRGVTAACTLELAKRTAGRFILVGRSQLTDWPEGLAPDLAETQLRSALARKRSAGGASVTPRHIATQARQLIAGREVRATLAAIEQAGGEACYLAADIADPAQTHACVRAAQHRFGAITGLVHGAGVLADKPIAEKTPDQLARVFAPKVNGLSNLLAALDLATLSHIGLFSSAAGRFGNPGQADYAMANEILAGVAHRLAGEHPHLNVKSIAWGPWDGGMVDDGLRTLFAARGVPLIPVKAGAEIFCDLLLATPHDAVEICVGGALTGE